MNMKRTIEFLIEAKKATYAGDGPKCSPSRPDSHDLKYEKEDLKYIDTYLGSKNFAGEEALWENDVSFWAMNYVGRILSNEFSGKFLKEALTHVPIDMPYRGPGYYENEGYIYKCSVNGDFGWFSGCEEIFYKNEKVYECKFHGGTLK